MFAWNTLSTMSARFDGRIRALAVTSIIVTTVMIPVPGTAQVPVVIVRDVQPIAGTDRVELCATRLREENTFIGRVAEALARPEKEAADQALGAMEPYARLAVEDTPDDIDARYRLAVIVGARSEVTSGRTRIRLANELHALTSRILEAEPEHPGANYILGRLHAGVMRLGRIQRFLARKLVGGAALNNASWEDAQRHLETAAAGDSCVPDHHFELARVYVERGQIDAARRELEYAIQLTEVADRRWNRVRSRAVALQDEVTRN